MKLQNNRCIENKGNIITKKTLAGEKVTNSSLKILTSFIWLTCFNLIDYLMEFSSVTWCSTFTATNFTHINSSWLLGVKFFWHVSESISRRFDNSYRNWRRRNHAGRIRRMSLLSLHRPLKYPFDGNILQWTIRRCWKIQTVRPWTDSFESRFLCQETLNSIRLQSSINNSSWKTIRWQTRTRKEGFKLSWWSYTDYRMRKRKTKQSV